MKSNLLKLTRVDLATVKSAKVPSPRHWHATFVGSGILTSHALVLQARGSEGDLRPHASFDTVGNQEDFSSTLQS